MPESHTSYELSTTPRSPEFHNQGRDGNTEWYRQWQAQYDGQSRIKTGTATDPIVQDPIRSADEPDRAPYLNVAWVKDGESKECPPPVDDDKPWICHPVNGKGELGNGWNLINPDHASSHIDEGVYPVEPYWMHMSNDGLRHDRYADLKAGADGKDQDDYTCPGGELNEIEVPGKPDITDPCGPRNIRWTEIPTDTETVELDRERGRQPDRHADLSCRVQGRGAVGDVHSAGRLERAVPARDIAVPAMPTRVDPCGPNNATWNVPEDTEVLDWDLSEGVLTVTILTPDTVFENTEGAASKNYGVAVDSNTPCPPNEIPLPATPTQSDPCGPGNATWNVPADTQQLDWNLTNGVFDAVILTPNTVFANSGGASSKNYGMAVDSNTPCPPNEIALPAAAGINDPCDPGNAEWIVPADDETFQVGPGRR